MKNFLRIAAPSLLIILFVYAGASKAMTFAQFGGQLHNQNFPGWMADILLYTLIPAELLTAALLAVPATQRAGLFLSTLLLTLFSGYIALVLLHFWQRVPCSCGGILARMSWGAHLVFNLFFLLLSLSALVIPSQPGTRYPA